MRNKNILIIALSFSPNAKVGSRRSGFLSQIFQQQYFNCHVLTVKKKYFLQHDNSVPFGGTIHRTGMYPPFTIPIKRISFFQKVYYRLWSNYFSLSDPFTGWILPSFFKGLRIINRYKTDVILVSVPPFSPMITALLLSSLTRVKLIVDYRDPWTSHPRTYRGFPFKEKLNKLVEKSVVKRSSASVFCSNIMKDNFVRYFAKHIKGIPVVITNGFNFSDNVTPLYIEKKKKVMLYAGTFYGGRKLALLAQPLQQLLEQGLITKQTFCFYVFGELMHDDKKVINEAGLSDIIKEHPPVEYQTMIRYMKGADILFLPSGADYNYAIPFKFFDYLSVRRPIFAVAAEDSAVAYLMNEIDCGLLACINCKESIRQGLQEIILKNRVYSFSGIEKYTWDVIAKRYKELIERVC